ncbi:MAG TPA: 2-oxoacid:acceptor oxidoreductase family protein [bacterium]|nr:2-oxoacid:acceptor oxidoreductase family protein [bacterium]
MDSERIKIRIAGAGGHGVVLASIILAEAAGVHDGKFVCQSQSYGPEARGGVCKAEIVISNGYIDYPKAKNLDVLMCYNQQSLDEYFHNLKNRGILIVNSDYCTQVPITTGYEIPMATLSMEKTGMLQTMNVLSLGVLAAITGIVSRRALKQAVSERVPKPFLEDNLKAFEAGFRAGSKAAENAKKRKPAKFSRLILMDS